jgi:PAS domain S-box-containing protein
MQDRGHVFIVDDNPYSADLLQELLEKNGYTVDRAACGEDALAAIPTAEPNLVLLDAHLPDIDPFTLCGKLKRGQQTLDIPVIFMSVLDDAETRAKGVELGDDLITKPFETREVLARVERQVTVSKVRMALRESEAKFQSVMESAIDSIISGDVSGNIRSWNRAATALFGYTAAEAIGQPIELIIPKRFHKSHKEGLHRVSSGGPSHVIGKTVEVAAVRKNGSEFPVELSLATWILDDERYYTGIIRDISERKQAEQKFRSVTESAIDAIISADHTGVIVSWNNAATHILGYSSEDAIGQRLELIIPERFHEAHREGMKRVTAGGESRVIGSTVELFARTKNGKEVPIELSLSTWTVHEDRYYTGIIRDITERKEAETQMKEYAEQLAQQHEELKRAQSQLIESEKQAILGRLLAGLLHELNTPLGALRSATDSIGRILKNHRDYVSQPEDKGDPGASKALRELALGDELSEVISASTKRIEGVIEGLAHFVTLDDTGAEVHDLREILESVVTLLSPQAGARIHIDTRLPDEPAPVRCDRGRLSHSFLNVVQNAVEAIDDSGEVLVSLEMHNQRLEVRITDSGHGMTPEQVANAFDFSFSSKEGRVRLGLALATSKRAVVEAGGTLTLESTLGKGSVVCISLPAAEE